MTISSELNRKDHVGNNSTVVFAYTFRIDDEDDLDVYLDNVLQTITTHYSVAGVGAAGGGSITFVTAPESAVAVALVRGMDFYQLVDYSAYTKFPEDVHELALDKLTMQQQQLKEELDRAVVGNPGDATTYVLPSYAAGEYWRWNALTQTIETATLGTLNAVSVGLAVGDLVALVSAGVGTTGFPALPLTGPLDSNAHQLQTSKGADIVSAAALPILTDGNYYHVTGSNTITSINTSGRVGTEIVILTVGSLVLTHHATNLSLPTRANITSQAGDLFKFVEYEAGHWVCTGYVLANGRALAPATGSILLDEQIVPSSASVASLDFSSDIDATYDEYELRLVNLVPASDGEDLLLRTSSDAGVSFDNGGSDYKWAGRGYRSDNVADIAAASAASSSMNMTLGYSVGGASGETGVSGSVTVVRPAAAEHTQVYGNVCFLDDSAYLYTAQISGIRLEAADVDALQLAFSAGNIESGTARLYGIAK